MRVTFILPGLSDRPIGGFAVVYEHASRLRAAGHEVSIVHSRRWLGTESPSWRLLAHLHAHLRNPSTAVDWYPIHTGVDMRIEPDLAKSSSIPAGDVIVATSWETAQYVHSYPPSKGRKYYLIQHFESWSGQRAAVEATWRLPLTKVVVSKWLLEIAEGFGVRDSTIYVPNGIDQEHFRTSVPPASRDRQLLAWSYHPAPWKGAREGLDAFRIVRGFRPIFVQAFGPYARPRRWPPWIWYVERPSRPALAELLNSASIFVLSSHSEGFGLPAAEAMACSCAAAAFDSGGIRDFAIDGQTALLSPAGDVEALAASITKLIEDDTLRGRLASAGRQAVNRLTWANSSRRLELALLGAAETR